MYSAHLPEKKKNKYYVNTRIITIGFHMDGGNEIIIGTYIDLPEERQKEDSGPFYEDLQK
jgi:hypothetical protein